MAITSTTFNVTFRLDTGVFEIDDTTDYPAQGSDPNDVTASIIITDPTGDVITQTGFSVGAVNSSINIPALSNGEYIMGQYLFEYTTIDSSDSSTATESKTFEFCHTSPDVEVEMVYDCIQPLLTATDTTDYRAGGITPTVSRNIEIHYPIGTGTNPVSATTQAICTNIFYTKTHTGKVDSDILYDYTNGVFIRDIITGSKEVNVVCDNTLCDLYCCLLDMYTKFKDAQANNRTLASDLEAKWLRAESLRSLIKDSYECNKQENAADLIADVLKLGDCSPGCGCVDGDEPSLIGAIANTPVIPTTNTGGGTGGGEVNTGANLGAGQGVFANKVGAEFKYKSLIAGSNIAIDSDSDTITIKANIPSGGGFGQVTRIDPLGQGTYGTIVTSSVSGNLTRYNIGLNAATITKLNNIVGTSVEAGVGTDVVQTVVNGDKVYTVSSTIDQAESFEAVYRFSTDFSTIPVIETIYSSLKGTKFQAPTISFGKKPASFLEAWKDIATPLELFQLTLRILVKDFLSTPSDNYIPESRFLGLYEIETQTVGGISVPVPSLMPLDANFNMIESFSRVSTANSFGESVNQFVVNTFNGTGIITGSILARNRRAEYFYFTIKLT